MTAKLFKSRVETSPVLPENPLTVIPKSCKEIGSATRANSAGCLLCARQEVKFCLNWLMRDSALQMGDMSQEAGKTTEEGDGTHR